MSSPPDDSKGKSRKAAPATQPGAVFVPTIEEPSESLPPNRVASNYSTTNPDIEVPSYDVTNRRGELFRSESSSGRKISNPSSSPLVSNEKKSLSKLPQATRPGAIAVSAADSNYSLSQNAKFPSMFENNKSNSTKPTTTHGAIALNAPQDHTVEKPSDRLKSRGVSAITPGAVHVTPTSSNTEGFSREAVKEMNFGAKIATLQPNQLSVLTTEERESQMSRAHSSLTIESADRQILGAPQPPEAILGAKPGAYSVISSQDDMATRKDPKARYRNLHQQDSSSKSVQMEEKQRNQSFGYHAEHMTSNTDVEYQKRFEENVFGAEDFLEKPKNSFDPIESWDAQTKDQEVKMFDTHPDQSKPLFPEHEQDGQVTEPRGIFVTGDRGMATHPDTMYGTNLQGNFGPYQDNGLAIAVAVNEDDDDRFLPSAMEYDPDAKPPIYLNRRFRLYMIATACLFFLVILTIIIGLVVLRGGSSTSLNDAPTFAPTSLQDSAYFKLFAQSLNYQEWQFTEDSPYGRAAKWIMEEDERKLSQLDEGLDQRFLLAVFYFITTSNGESPWLSCNPDFTNSSNEICDFETYTINEKDEVEYIPKPSYRWLSKVHECDWAGHLCDDSSITRAIELLGQNITGTLPTELVAFPFLQSISLAFNEFTGTLPIEYASPDKARHLINLEVHGNKLTGTIPKEYYLATGLQNLNIGENHLTGTLSSEIGFLTGLKGLHTFSNMISGPIPTEIGNLEYLAFTRHSENMYNGTIPTEFGNLLQIQEVWLGMNYFTGSIPSELGLLTDMTDLGLYENKLDGTIPSELYSLSKLSYLILHSNFLSGTISTEIGNLAAINGLLLSRNQLTGTIPTELGSLYSLHLLLLHVNKLVGSVPIVICDLMSKSKDSILQADCFPVGNEPNPCPCCTACCSRETEICLVLDANDPNT